MSKVSTTPPKTLTHVKTVQKQVNCHLFALPLSIIVQSPLLHDMSSSKEIEFFVSDSFLHTQTCGFFSCLNVMTMAMHYYVLVATFSLDMLSQLYSLEYVLLDKFRTRYHPRSVLSVLSSYLPSIVCLHSIYVPSTLPVMFRLQPVYVKSTFRFVPSDTFN